MPLWSLYVLLLMPWSAAWSLAQLCTAPTIDFRLQPINQCQRPSFLIAQGDWSWWSNERSSKGATRSTDGANQSIAEMSMDWIHPWIGLDWIGSVDCYAQNFDGLWFSITSHRHCNIAFFIFSHERCCSLHCCFFTFHCWLILIKNNHLQCHGLI